MSANGFEIIAEAPVLTVRLTGSLDRATVPEIYGRLKPLFGRGGPISVDMSGVGSIDSAGVGLLATLIKRFGGGEGGARFLGLTAPVANAMRLAGWRVDSDEGLVPEESGGFVETLGQETRDVWVYLLKTSYILSESFYHGIIGPFKGERPRIKIFIEHLARIGAGSAPIVLLVAILVGLTTAFQAAQQLRQFGANIYIADLVGISMMRELGPLMAAILVAGRSGAAITAEIGTMQVNEEIDAMKLLGINPIQYLAVPRIYAVTISQPLLGVMSALTGILGGYAIAILYLDLNSAAYVAQTLKAVRFDDLTFNLMKSMVFGWIIVVVSVYYGLSVRGGAEAVGKATTSSVVAGIVMIIIADCIFSFT